MKRCWATDVLATVGAIALTACGPTAPTLDVASPRVLSVIPADGATGVTRTTTVTACLDHALRPDTAIPSNVILSRTSAHHTTEVGAAVGLSADGRCVELDPAAPLAPQSHYQLDLRKGLLSLSGVALGSKSVPFSASFTTAAQPARATLFIPSDGMLAAPLDLSQILMSFSQPVFVATDGGAPFAVSPGGGHAMLSLDGRIGFSPFLTSVAGPGRAIAIDLNPSLRDNSDQSPGTGGLLGFTLGNCAEGSAPNVGGGTVVARDRDGLLTFVVDRPSVCNAAINDPACPDAGAVATQAQCDAPYDPCTGGVSCLCTVPLVELCPGDSLDVTPEVEGFNGQLGSAAPVPTTLSPALPQLVLTEVFAAPKATAFIEVQNRGPAPLDLLGLTLADCAGSLGCASPGKQQAFGAFQGNGTTALAAGAYALLVDPTFDPSTAPAEALLLSPIEQASLLHLSTSHVQTLAIFSPNAAAPLSTQSSSALPRSGLSLERTDPSAPDCIQGNWALSQTAAGTPGACNSSTPGPLCDAVSP